MTGVSAVAVCALKDFGMRARPTWDIIPMRSLSETQFWFVVAAVALTPMLTFWIAGVIGWFLRHTLWRTRR
jgi:hypothetical protein